MVQRSFRRFGCAFAAAFVLLLLPALASAAVSPVVAGPPMIPHGTVPQRLQSLLGLAVFTTLAWLLGRATGARTRIRTRTLVWGILLQFIFGIIVIWNRTFLEVVTAGVQALLGYAGAGAALVFGDLSTLQGPGVYGPNNALLGYAHSVGYFAFFVLPTIIFFSCLTAIAYHSGIMQFVVQALAWVMAKTMGCSGAETLCTAANIFVGQAEAPLMVKPFVAVATNSELMAMMVIGFANIASGVLGLYSIWLAPYVPDAAGHLAAACFIAAPGSLLVSKLLKPETEVAVTSAGVQFKIDRIDANLVDAAARGTHDGLKLAVNVAAMLISFTAIITMVDAILSYSSVRVEGLFGAAAHPISLELILGYVFRPLAWLAGVSWKESQTVGSLLGIKTVLNELIAYSQMKDILAVTPGALSPRARLLATYALCGFANFASVGIQVGGISTIAPSRRVDLSRLGLLAMVGGALASLMAASVIGVLV